MSTSIPKHVKQAQLNNEESIQWLFNYYEDRINSIVEHFIHKYKPIVLDKEDFRQDCYIGLLKCVNQSNKFCKEVFWYMIREVKTDIVHNALCVKLPVNTCAICSDEELLLYIKDNFSQCTLDGVYETSNWENVSCYNIMLEQCKDILTEKEFDILKLYYKHDWSFSQIGKKYHISGERAKQYRNRAVKKCIDTFGLSKELFNYNNV